MQCSPVYTKLKKQLSVTRYALRDHAVLPVSSRVVLRAGG